MLHPIIPGAIGNVITVFLRDATAGGSGMPGLAAVTPGLECWVRGTNDLALTQVLLFAQGLDSFSDGGFDAIDNTKFPGRYRFCIPDALCSGASDEVEIVFSGVANMYHDPITLTFSLSEQLAALQSNIFTVLGALSTSIPVDTTNRLGVMRGTVNAPYDTQIIDIGVFINDFGKFEKWTFAIVDGTGAGQLRGVLQGPSGGTSITLDIPLLVAPDNTSTWMMWPVPRHTLTDNLSQVLADTLFNNLVVSWPGGPPISLTSLGQAVANAAGALCMPRKIDENTKYETFYLPTDPPFTFPVFRRSYSDSGGVTTIGAMEAVPP